MSRGGLLRSTAVFSGMTFLSRLAGLARDLLQATLFGTGPAVSATCPESSPANSRNSRAIHGANSIPSPVTTTTTASSAPATWSRKSCKASGSPRWCSSDSTGTNADENEPSAKMRRR